MALTAAEEQELAQLEAMNGSAGGATTLTPAEEQELAQLNAQAGQISAQTPALPQVENDMHPEMKGLKGLKVRTVYKALGADPVASFNYLEKEFPELEFSKDKSGEVLVKTRGDMTGKAYRLDPSGFDVRDITDLAYDVPAAVAQGAATAAAGLAGAPAGGIGAVPAAMAGSAASGVGLEALRNKLGQMAGIEQGQDAKDLAIAGVSGAVAPLLFGTGASLSGAAAQAAKQGGKQTAQEILQTQRGLVGRGYDAVAGYVGPSLANLAGGENKKVISQAAKMLPEIKAADTNPDVLAEPLREAATKVSKSLRETTQKVGNRLDEIRAMIDTPPVATGREVGPFTGNMATGREVGPFTGNMVDGQMLKNQGTIDAKPFTQPFLDLAAELQQTSSGSAADRQALEELQNVMKKEFEGMPEYLTAAQVEAKRARFKELAESYGKKYSNTGSSVSSGAAGIEGRLADAFESSRMSMNDGITKRLEQINPELAAEYMQTREAYGALVNLSKEQKNNFKNAKGVQNFLNRSMNDDIAASDLAKVQQITGVDLEDLAVRSKAIQTFSKPKTEVRSLGTSNTARQVGLGVLGGTAGYYAGQQSGGDYSPFLMAALGGYVGTKAASPAMIRKYMEMNAVMRQAPSEIPGMQMLPYTLINANKNDQK